ncbi:MAG: hypothetical protein U0136_06850 [Bdellovibrionota bacterium]
MPHSRPSFWSDMYVSTLNECIVGGIIVTLLSVFYVTTSFAIAVGVVVTCSLSLLVTVLHAASYSDAFGKQGNIRFTDAEGVEQRRELFGSSCELKHRADSDQQWICIRKGDKFGPGQLMVVNYDEHTNAIPGAEWSSPIDVQEGHYW